MPVYSRRDDLLSIAISVIIGCDIGVAIAALVLKLETSAKEMAGASRNNQAVTVQFFAEPFTMFPCPNLINRRVTVCFENVVVCPLPISIGEFGLFPCDCLIPLGSVFDLLTHCSYLLNCIMPFGIATGLCLCPAPMQRQMVLSVFKIMEPLVCFFKSIF